MNLVPSHKVMKFIPAGITRRAGRQILVLKKNSPHIFFGLGLTGMVGSTVLACRATLKLSQTLDDIQKEIATVKELESHTDDFRKDLTYVYAKGAMRISRLYGPSVVVGGAAIGALAGSHVQLTRRNAALMAAYSLVQQAFEDYRERVRAQVGVEKEEELFLGAKSVKGVDGLVIEPTGLPAYARFFDEYSTQWQKNAELNRFFLECQLRYMNDRLHAYGHVFLNEVYDRLGFERTPEGAVVGWLRNCEGDSYIDFGLDDPGNSRFAQGIERSVLLTFNVDGVIWDKI